MPTRSIGVFDERCVEGHAKDHSKQITNNDQNFEEKEDVTKLEYRMT